MVLGFNGATTLTADLATDIRAAKAAEAIGIGPRQLRRLRAKLRAPGLRSPRRRRPPRSRQRLPGGHFH